MLDRNANGVSILTVDNCQQPLAADGFKIPVDPATCAVQAGNETLLQAVDFARMSVARSPASVMDKQMADVLVNLSTAQCLTLDPAGRLVYSIQETTTDLNGDGDTNDLVSSAVDSPLQNLAIYRELITKGTLGNPAIVLPKPFTQYGILDTAAKALGAASDKSGKINIDLVVYLNQILGLDLPTTTTQLPKTCINIKQEVKGVVQTVNKCFLNYSAYNYERSQTYGNLPFPKNIPATNLQLGFFDYLTPYQNQITTDGRPLFYIKSASIVPTVFVSLPATGTANIRGFAQASDDARAVIDFMHSHPVMAGYEARVLCEGSAPPPPPVIVDVSSKLQMPTRMVGNTTREGTLTVNNLKGAPATGSVQLVGKDSTGKSLLVYQNGFNALAAGKSVSFTIPFKGSNYATTITWTATATAAGDNNTTNNTATFTTTVTAPRGRGGRGGRGGSDDRD
ncbi:MAG: hypothetical protein Q8Q54_18175 [Methylococcales bacterium]|nr:hypothetical protein [Methylococcales bacterium]MDP3840846.1 hypothetical protein [Methylococcales bacterium]